MDIPQFCYQGFLLIREDITSLATTGTIFLSVLIAVMSVGNLLEEAIAGWLKPYSGSRVCMPLT
jgi:hypothetical protein